MDAALAQKIVQQLEYYFSDSNLLKDKFLKAHLETSPEGWVPLTVLVTFNRLKELSTDVAVIAAAVKAADSQLLEVSADDAQIRRTPSKPLPSQSVINKRSIYAKNFPLEGTTIDSVTQYFAGKGVKVLSVLLRKMSAKDGKNAFKGSVFVEFSTPEEATKIASEKHSLAEGVDLLVELKDAYFARKRDERKAKAHPKDGAAAADGAGEADGAAAAVAKKEVQFTKGCILAVSGLTDGTTRENIKEVFSPHGDVAWVDFQKGDTEGHVRFAEEGGATKAAAAISAAAVTINEVAPVLRVLEGAEEVAYWEEVAKDRSAAKKRRQGNSGGGGRGGGRGRGGRGRGRGGRGGAGGKRQGGPQGGTAKAART